MKTRDTSERSSAAALRRAKKCVQTAWRNRARADRAVTTAIRRSNVANERYARAFDQLRALATHIDRT